MSYQQFFSTETPVVLHMSTSFVSIIKCKACFTILQWCTRQPVFVASHKFPVRYISVYDSWDFYFLLPILNVNMTITSTLKRIKVIFVAENRKYITENIYPYAPVENIDTPEINVPLVCQIGNINSMGTQNNRYHLVLCCVLCESVFIILWLSCLEIKKRH